MSKPIYRSIVSGLLIALLLLAVWLRLWRLPELPPGLWYDEAYEAMDAIRLLDTGQPQIFFPGNNGREPLLPYLVAPSLAVLGTTPYALRLVSALIGIVTTALLFRWVATLFSADPDRYWLALFAAAGFTVSFWHLAMSRAGYRAILFPFFVILTSHLFWRGWQRRSWPYFIGAGVVLGLSQYTYLSARLLPLVFALFSLLGLLVASKQQAVTAEKDRSGRKMLWLGLLLMAVVSLIVFLPLGLFYWHHPQTFSGRTGDVAVFEVVAQGKANFLPHLLDALRVFGDGFDPNWRHGIVGQPAFDLLSLIGFWLGLLVALWQIRRPAYVFLLISLVVLWLPAPLSVPPVHSLRLSGMLPAFYALMAVGLLLPVRWLKSRTAPSLRLPLRLAALALIVLVSGGRTTYDYFIRWADEPVVYDLYNGGLTDLTRRLRLKAGTADILLPIDLYGHPTVRFLLHDTFREVNTLPALTPGRPALLVTEPDEPPAGFVWLTIHDGGEGLAYTSRPLRPDDLTNLPASGPPALFSDRSGRTIAALTPLTSVEPLLPLLANRVPTHTVTARLGDQVRLIGYEVWPPWLRAGETPTLNLTWQPLPEQPLEYAIFLQLLNSRGEPIGQIDGLSLTDEFRWRPGLLAPQRYPLWLAPDIKPGLYFIRLGLFDLGSGARVPVYNAVGAPSGDQILLGLFYVSDGPGDPRRPAQPLQARLGDGIELLGYQLGQIKPGAAALHVQLHWQASERMATNYTVFIQLLDAENQRVAGWDAQPLHGQYPTSAWSPGEIIVEGIDLPFPPDLAPGDYHLITGMYDLATGQRLPAYDETGQPLADGMINLQAIRFAD